MRIFKVVSEFSTIENKSPNTTNSETTSGKKCFVILTKKSINGNMSSKACPANDNYENSCKIISPVEDTIEIKDSDSENELEGPNYDIVLDDNDFDNMELNQEFTPSLQSKKDKISENQIFIGNLPISIKKIHIVKFFERSGEISDAMLIHSKGTIGYKKAMCFLTYAHSNSVNDALENNGLFYCGRNFCVSRVGRRPVQIQSTISIHSLPYGTTIQELYNVFEECGPIKSQYLELQNKNLLGLAYITFDFPQSARYAVLIENFKIKNCQVYVRAYTNQREMRGLSNLIS